MVPLERRCPHPPYTTQKTKFKNLGDLHSPFDVHAVLMSIAGLDSRPVTPPGSHAFKLSISGAKWPGITITPPAPVEGVACKSRAGAETSPTYNEDNL
jgi:hypothetical protein